MDHAFLPTGSHWGLHIERHVTEDAGDFAGGGHKLVWHTTEGTDFNAMARVLVSKRAAPHILIDPTRGLVMQMVPFTRAARALEHPAGTAETNRANCIQVEVCGYAKDTGEWSHEKYRHLAALAVLIEHRVPIVRKAPRKFGANATRYTGSGFVRARGHVGHQHVPNNSHWDPGAFSPTHLFRHMREVEKEYT